MSSIVEKILDVPAEHESNVFGQFDSHIKKIEQTLKVSVVARDGAVKILGPAANTRQAARVFEQLLELSRRGNVIQEQMWTTLWPFLWRDRRKRWWRSTRI